MAEAGFEPTLYDNTYQQLVPGYNCSALLLNYHINSSLTIPPNRGFNNNCLIVYLYNQLKAFCACFTALIHSAIKLVLNSGLIPKVVFAISEQYTSTANPTGSFS